MTKTCLSAFVLLLLFPLTPAAGETTSFPNAVEAFYRSEFQAHPISATQIGVHDYDAEVDDLSEKGILQDIAYLHQALETFAAFDPATLPPGDRNDREMLMSSIRGKLLDLEAIGYWRKDPSIYLQTAVAAVFGLVHRDFAPLEVRLRSVIVREKKIPALLAAGKVNVQHAPRAFVDIASRNVTGAIDFIKARAPAAFASVEDDELKRGFVAANDAVLAALEDYKTYLEQQLKPRADGVFALGPELFAQRLAYDDMIDITPVRLRDIAHTQLRKDRDALALVAREVDPIAPTEITLQKLRADHPSAAALIPTARDDLSGLRSFIIARDIVTIPGGLLPDVQETPAFRRATTAAAVDLPGPLEQRATQAFYYVTPPDAGLSPEQTEKYLEAYFFSGLEIISAHEVWPGHFMQYLTRKAHPEWPLARKMAHAYATTEGWAHYTEQMMTEEGFGDAKVRLAQLQMALLRDCRFVAALEMHTRNKSVDDAAKIFIDECGSPEPEARREAYRGARDPGYINYTLGKLAILKLREDYRAKLGSQFSLRTFHDRLLAAGLVPIKIIRREMLGEDGPLL